MIGSATLAISQILSPPFRAVLWKSVGLTLVLLIAIWIGLQGVLAYFLVLPFPWLETAISIISGFGLLVGLAFFIAPATALFAGLFLDEIAAIVEEESDPDGPRGNPLPLVSGLMATVGFFGIVVVVNLIALPLVLVLGFGVLVFFVANAYLLGREYFQMAALRFHDTDAVKAMRVNNGARLFMAGMVIAGFLAIPIVNLLTPLFATAFMVHMHKRIEARERQPGGVLATA